MAQANKKSSASKAASATANRAAKVSLSAVETGRNQAENVVKMGSDAVRGFIASGAEEAAKAQEKVFAIGREGAENFSRSADAATRSVNEALALTRDNAEAMVECGNIAACMAKDLSTEVFNIANNSFAQNVEISKEVFSCRTINDVFDLQSRIMRGSLDSFFNDGMKISELVFQYTSEAVEPLNERMVEATERLSKALSA